MAITLPTQEQVGAYIGNGTSVDPVRLAEVYETATELVSDAFAGAYREVPDSIVRQVVCDTAQNLWKRRDAANGNQISPVDGGFPLPNANDPLRKSRPLIARYVVTL